MTLAARTVRLLNILRSVLRKTLNGYRLFILVIPSPVNKLACSAALRFGLDLALCVRQQNNDGEDSQCQPQFLHPVNNNENRVTSEIMLAMQKCRDEITAV